MFLVSCIYLAFILSIRGLETHRSSTSSKTSMQPGPEQLNMVSGRALQSRFSDALSSAALQYTHAQVTLLTLS
ncbi:uncharacterized protein BP01DRAFT_110329 [Aspergillus saccharolyticus JOP 1030-1]|uniref:Uncharacterized protein n=1 Tax=Aspergillus saccharolyticus JOP 1030-1 TaxID=1450539 RepID=A0A318ZHL2_9EURO|nr:hypothetical protein BP01DRAFT_110329 [Aspergillus saccharolyticus JOP 1030-1]PYH43180.1 hypothetical protein BP01DRAFT_110329 [Aspergillus saccharolyticus JOP 1030-1]